MIQFFQYALYSGHECDRRVKGDTPIILIARDAVYGLMQNFGKFIFSDQAT